MKSFLQSATACIVLALMCACGGGSDHRAQAIDPLLLAFSPRENQAEEEAVEAIEDDLEALAASDARALPAARQLGASRIVAAPADPPLEPRQAGRLALAGVLDARLRAELKLAGLEGVSSRAIPSWDGKVVIDIEKMPGSPVADRDIYWAIVGRDWKTNRFVHVGANGEFVDMRLDDNGALVKNDERYTNYFHRLSDVRSVTIPALNSARILFSQGGPMYIQTNTDINGNLGYTGANIENTSDPNLDVLFDFVEFAMVDMPTTRGMWANTTRVDHFGFPIRLTLESVDGFLPARSVGEDGSETREMLFEKFRQEVAPEFAGLVKPPYRIVAPAHDSFHAGYQNAAYLDAYIAEIWEMYKTRPLVVDIELGRFTGQVQDDGSFVFTDGQGRYAIRRAPTTAEALLGNGVLDDAGTLGGLEKDKQLQLQAQLCAALNRHIAEDAGLWKRHPSFYAKGPNNSYAAFWHRHNIGGLSYGFAYDDVSEASSSLYSPAPKKLTVAIGW